MKTQNLNIQIMMNILEKYLYIKGILESELIHPQKLQNKPFFTMAENKNFINTNSIKDYQFSPISFENYQNYVATVENVFHLLLLEEYEVIYHEFLVNPKASKWWQQWYDEIAFEKIKQQTIFRFLSLYLV